MFNAWEVLSPAGELDSWGGGHHLSELTLSVRVPLAGHSSLTKHQLLDGLRLFYPQMEMKDLKPYIGAHSSGVSVDKIRHLLFKQDCPVSECGLPGTGRVYLPYLIIIIIVIEG